MTIHVIDSLDRLRDLRPEWLALWKSCPRATPFQLPQWLLPWTQHLYGGGEIWVITMRDQGELIGAAPLFCWGVERKTVSFLGAGISDYADLVAKPESEDVCAAEMWEQLTRRQNRWQVLDLQQLRPGSPLLKERWGCECDVCPVLDLSRYPDCMDHKHRTDVRRTRNRLSKQHSIQFRMASQDTLPQAFDEFLELYEKRWGPMEDPLERFHRHVTKEFLDSNMLRLCALQIDGRPAASIYAFANRQILYCYLSGFEPEFAKLSPGAVLLEWLIERALEEGVRTVDFLRRPEAYKYLWGARDRANYTLHLVRDAQLMLTSA